MSDRYIILSAGTAIRCLTCFKVSYNQDDVKNLYCGWCCVFHEDEDRKVASDKNPATKPLDRL